jgi:hypothetical protein
MFWKKRTPAWLENLEDLDWMISRAGFLLDFYGRDQFERPSPILVKGNHGVHLPDAPEEYLRAISLEMVAEARIPVKDVRVEIYSEDSVYDVLTDLGIPHTTETEAGTAGMFHKIDSFGVATIAVEEGQLQDHLSLAGTLAHELTHVFLHLKRPDEEDIWPADEEEFVTDLTSVLLGFGIFMCNSVERFRKYSDGQLSGWSTSTQGYLSLEEMCVAQALASSYFGQDFRSYSSHISGNPRKLIEQALPYLQENFLEPEP